MKVCKKCLIGLLSMTLVCNSMFNLDSLAVPITSTTNDSKEIVYSGKCGDNLTYEFDQDTHTLTIKGTGEMYGFGSWKNEPWLDFSSSIQNLVVEEGVTSIGDHAFCSTNIISVTLPESLVSIGDVSFSNVPISEIYIPSNVKDMVRTCFDLTHLTSIVVSEDNPYYASLDGVVYTKDMSTLLIYPGSKKDTSFTIPDGVTTIYEKAFFSNYFIQDLIIPDTVTEIQNGAFNMSNLVNVTIPDSVTVIKEYVFSWTDIESITIPDSVTTIENYAFFNCTELKVITIPSSVTEIGDKVFKCLEENDDLVIVTPNGSTAWNYAIENGIKVVESLEYIPNDLYGDVDGDDLLTTLDLLLIKRYILGLDSSIYYLADYNQDEHINLLDFVQLKSYLLKSM